METVGEGVLKGAVVCWGSPRTVWSGKDQVEVGVSGGPPCLQTSQAHGGFSVRHETFMMGVLDHRVQPKRFPEGGLNQKWGPMSRMEEGKQRPMGSPCASSSQAGRERTLGSAQADGVEDAGLGGTLGVRRS